jgi:hypothetical protein
MRHFLKLFIMLLLVSTILYADGEDYILVTNIGTSARSLGMGGVEGFSDAADAVFENPAGLTRFKEHSLSAFGTTLMDEVTYRNLALSSHTKYGYFGIGYMQASILSIPETAEDADGEYIVSSLFDYSSSFYKVSYANKIKENLYGGLTYTKYMTQFYSLKGVGSNVDLGFLLYRPHSDISLVFKNIITGADVNYNNGSSENLPLISILSLKLKLPMNMDIIPQIKYQQDNVLWGIGGRYTPSFAPVFSISTGYKQFLTVVKQHRQNVSMGVGLNLFGMHFDYAYEKSDYVLSDNKNYFSMSILF